jgi:hypothetical protein
MAVRPQSFLLNPGAAARVVVASLVTGALLLSLRGTAHAGGGAATDSYEGIRPGPIDLHGLADVYSQTAFNRPASETNQLRAFDLEDGQPQLGILRLTLAHNPDPIGFRLDIGIGDIPNGYLRYDPAAAAHPGLSRGLSYVEQAFVTAMVPLGRGLKVDVGKFETPIGLEDNEAVENWNYSRSLLYLLAEPSYHAGLRLTYPVTSTVAVSLLWVNGWDANVLDGNNMRAVAAAVSWHPAPGLEVVADYMGGLERAPTRLSDPVLSFRNEFDAYARYALTKRLAFAWTGDYGQDAASSGVSWWGMGGYCRVQALDWLAGSVRAEHYDDGDGFTTGTRQRLAEVTATAEVRGEVGPTRWIGRLEYRRDQSDEAFFETGGRALSTRQDTMGASLLAAF